VNGCTPVLLVPGFMTDGDLWRDMADDLAAIGPIVYADLGDGDTIEAMARHAASSCPSPCVLVGFSMGGYIAREMVRLVPDKVAALVLIATSARADTPQQTQRKANASRTVSASSYRGLSTPAIKASLASRHANDQPLIARVQAMGLRLGYDEFIRQSTLARPGDLDRLGDIHCPTLVIATTEDQLRTLDEAKELRDGIPGSTLQVIENSGHMVPLEQPGPLAASMTSWLRGIDIPDQRIIQSIKHTVTM